MAYHSILFDLDGTLTDPALGITNSIQYALGQMALPVPPREELYDFIGPPLKAMFIQRFGLTDAQGEEALRCYREYFSVNGLFENRVYPGIPELLQKLRDAGKMLIIATSKPEVFTHRILEHFDLARYFHFVAGSLLDGTRVHKPDVIAHALEQCGLAHKKAETVMIGDRKFDIEGAKLNGLAAIGVTYGYGSEAELKTAGAMATAASPQALESLLL